MLFLSYRRMEEVDFVDAGSHLLRSLQSHSIYYKTYPSKCAVLCYRTIDNKCGVWYLSKEEYKQFKRGTHVLTFDGPLTPTEKSITGHSIINRKVSKIFPVYLWGFTTMKDFKRFINKIERNYI